MLFLIPRIYPFPTKTDIISLKLYTNINENQTLVSSNTLKGFLGDSIEFEHNGGDNDFTKITQFNETDLHLFLR